MFHVNVYIGIVASNDIGWKSVYVLVPHQHSGAMSFAPET